LIDPDTFRSVLGRFASGVTVVTTRDASGRDHGLTVSAFASLSLTPPLILICIDQSSSVHHVLRGATHFVVNVLSSGQEALSRRFSGRDLNRFDGIGYERGATGVAVLDDVLAYLECRLARQHDEGDHTIFIGEVEAADTTGGRPLIYYRGGYATIER
jgi:flavin reductase (DIM6/NTAB) family NADH-FMN oxidoreductase RutF